MEKEFSAALHPTQYGNHIKYGRNRATKPKKKEPEFDYDKATPKGEWV